ncbi:hypothetical protein DFJ73DRAFT_818051 [Zopfochytrium polystomum]|nr:hypothetical protein DFJ73DRAFT_818051 [Zopfochytrium polystomum]
MALLVPNTFAPPGNSFYGRMNLFVNNFPTQPDFSHWINVQLSGVGDGTMLRPIGGQFIPGQGVGQNTFWGVGADGGPTGDWTNWKTTQPAVNAKYVCFEYFVNAADNSVTVSMDGVPQPQLTVSQKNHGGTQVDLVFPVWNKIQMGWWNFQATTFNFQVFLDDIALSTSPIGCNANAPAPAPATTTTAATTTVANAPPVAVTTTAVATMTTGGGAAPSTVTVTALVTSTITVTPGQQAAPTPAPTPTPGTGSTVTVTALVTQTVTVTVPPPTTTGGANAVGGAPAAGTTVTHTINPGFSGSGWCTGDGKLTTQLNLQVSAVTPSVASACPGFPAGECGLPQIQLSVFKNGAPLNVVSFNGGDQVATGNSVTLTEKDDMPYYGGNIVFDTPCSYADAATSPAAAAAGITFTVAPLTATTDLTLAGGTTVPATVLAVLKA